MKVMRFACFFFILSSLTMASSFAALPTPQSPPKVVGHVVWAIGTLKAELPNGQPRNLKRHSEIYEHDTLMTDSNSQAKVMLLDRDPLTLAENSTVKIDEYQHAGQTKTQQEKNTFASAIEKFMQYILRLITGTITANNPGGYQPPNQ